MLLPLARSPSLPRRGRTGLHVDLEGNLFAWVLPAAAQTTNGTIPSTPWCTDEVCTVVAGHWASIASGSPSQHTMRMSRTPRLANSAQTLPLLPLMFRLDLT